MTPKFTLIEEQNSTSVALRVQKINNGFLLRAGGEPVFYSSMAELATAVQAGLLATQWPEIKTK